MLYSILSLDSFANHSVDKSRCGRSSDPRFGGIGVYQPIRQALQQRAQGRTDQN